MAAPGTIVHRFLLGAMVVCAFVSLAPPLRFASALALRGLALLDLVALGTTEKASRGGKLSLFLKGVGVVLAIVGIITALIPLSLAAFGVDIFLQLKGMWKSLTTKDPKVSDEKRIALFFAHLGFLIVDVLAVAAIATGGWQLAVAAASVSAATMFVIAIGTFIAAKLNNDLGGFFDAFCYFLLAGVGVSIARNSAKIVENRAAAKFVAKNDGEAPMALIDNKNQVIAVVAPGEVATPEIPLRDASIIINRGMSSPPFITTAVNGQTAQLFGVNTVQHVTAQEGVLQGVMSSLSLEPTAIPVDEALENVEATQGTQADGAAMDACCTATACCCLALVAVAGPGGRSAGTRYRHGR